MPSQTTGWGHFLGEPVGPFLVRSRLTANMTQAQVAEATGISLSTVSDFEVGSEEPSATALLRIVRATTIPTRPSSGGTSSSTTTTDLAPNSGLVSTGSDCTASGNEPAPGDQTLTNTAHAVDSSGLGEVSRLKNDLRERVLDHLRLQGFKPTDSGVLAPVERDKGMLRDLHDEAVAAQRQKAARSLSRHEPALLTMLADGQDVDPHNIDPYLELVDNRRSQAGLMWRWSALHWSIPVSSGYGRRLRFLVRDKAHGDAVIGLIGLGDPVFALGCRDDQIGWTRDQRRNRLACVMDAFVLGALPPYNRLLGGKLVALLAGSEHVRDAFAERYGHRTTLIADRDPHAQLALVTTSSALGRSSVYNRVTRPDRSLALRPIGFTQGSGDFHLSGAIYDDLVALALAAPSSVSGHRHERWTGTGFRNRREVIQRALTVLGFDSRAMRVHGVRRQVFANPLAVNSYDWLRGAEDQLDWYPADVESLSRWWRDRWAIPRSANDHSWRDVRADEWTLYT